MLNPFQKGSVLNTIFIYGLPSIGKSKGLSKLEQRDNYKDLALNLRGQMNIDGIVYTPNHIRIRYQSNMGAYMIEKNSRFGWNRSLRLYAYQHPDTRNILIDESEDFSAKKLLNLCVDLNNIFPRRCIFLTGVVYDTYNRMFSSSKYLLQHSKSFNWNPNCRYCTNRAQYMLDVYNGEKVTYHQLDQLDNKRSKYIKDHMSRYHVCPYHYLNPPMPSVQNPKLELERRR